jgi:hypothetical protein
VAGRYKLGGDYHGICIVSSTGVLPIPHLHKYLNVRSQKESSKEKFYRMKSDVQKRK